MRLDKMNNMFKFLSCSTRNNKKLNCSQKYNQNKLTKNNKNR